MTVVPLLLLFLCCCCSFVTVGSEAQLGSMQRSGADAHVKGKAADIDVLRARSLQQRMEISARHPVLRHPPGPN